MLHSLRNRLILSHILPLLIIIPLMGVVLLYALETQYVLPNLANELSGDAKILAEITSQQAGIWQDPLVARTALEKSRTSQEKRIMFIRPDGRLLASSDPADAERIDQPILATGLDEAKKGELVKRINLSQGLHGEVVDVFAPVFGSDQNLTGIVRVSYRYATLMEELVQFRFLIIGILILGLLSGAVLGVLLAVNIDRPIQEATDAIDELAVRGKRDPLPIQGPDEIQHLLQSVNFLVERLHNLEAARQQLLDNLVHELGRPLGGIRMAIQVSREGAKHDPVLLDELLEGMDEESERLEHLLDDLARLQDQVVGGLELNLQPVALAEWLPKVLLTWREAAEVKNLKWEESLATNLPVLNIDRDRIAQVLGNLISNAIKFTPSGGTVAVTAGAAENKIWIQVRDTGPGIPAYEQEQVFTPFFQGEQGRRIKQGMGLGLSIARDLAEAHFGKIELTSEPGTGSSFTLWLPVSAAV
jgi:signal transduction histidine kinase